jgi:hypothetical protein
VYAATIIGGLVVLAAVLAGTGVLAGPVCLAVVAGTMVLVGHRLCALADVAQDRPPTGLDEGTAAAADHPRPAIEPESTLDRRKAFWQSLSDHERHALLSKGRCRTFPKGSALFQHCEQAGHVYVVLSGWTKICVTDDGAERVIAKRGPGHLIGERAALRPSVRSAGAFALNDVVALVLSTGDFADFLAEHPRVLTLVEDEIYYRLTERAKGDPAGGVMRQAPHDVSNPSPDTATVVRPHFDGQNCTILLVDVVSFAAETRTDDDRRFVRLRLFEVVRGAFIEAGLGHLDRCHWEDRGDGFLIIVPPAMPTRTLLECLLPPLQIALQQHNRRSAEPVSIRLRCAVNTGPVDSDAVGVSGAAIIEAARILELDDFKRAIATETACLGVIAASHVYQSVIRHAPEALHAPEYREVQGRVKEAKVSAWMRLTGHAPSSH